MSKGLAVAAVDRISGLPDELLRHILSFLPTKLAFTTTLLSKRWTPLSYTPSVVRFDVVPEPDETFQSFCSFVDTLMLSPRSLNQPIKTFSLNFRNVVDDSDQPIINAWVEAAILRHVQEFHLGMHGHILTPIIFTSRTLVILKIQNLKVVADNLCFDLPSLKTLVLERVYFKNQKNDFVKLLNACPILEDLQLHTYYPRLRFMKRKDNNEVQEFKSLFLSKLVRAYIHIHSIDVPFDAINNVEYLCIIQDEEEHEEHSFEIKIEEVSFKGIPVFQNLIRIELWFFSVFRGWDGIVELLQRCLKLQIFFIRKWNSSLSKEWNCPISTLECVSSHLRSCTIFHFEGSKDDLQFATYILQNARLLEVMKINFFIQNYQVIEELSSCPRLSPGCKLSF